MFSIFFSSSLSTYLPDIIVSLRRLSTEMIYVCGMNMWCFFLLHIKFFLFVPGGIHRRKSDPKNSKQKKERYCFLQSTFCSQLTLPPDSHVHLLKAQYVEHMCQTSKDGFHHSWNHLLGTGKKTENKEHADCAIKAGGGIHP